MIKHLQKLKEMVACVCIDDESNGTAFLVDDCHVATAMHVLGRKRKVTLQFLDWQKYKDDGERTARLVWREPSGMDVAVLELDRACPAQVTILPWGELPETNSAWNTFGFPKGVPGGHASSKNNIVEDPEKLIRTGYSTVIQLSSGIANDILGGFSGSPCIVNGEVVGILATQLLRNDKPLFDTVYGLPIGLLKFPEITPPSSYSTIDLPGPLPIEDWKTFRQQLRRTNIKARKGKFIADEDRFSSVFDAFDGESLLSLHGSFGRGKTSLAEELARRTFEQYPDGVWIAELEHVVAPEGILHAIAEAMGVDEGSNNVDALVNRIGRGAVLLILDGCERMLDECQAISATLLDRCANLKILLTTQDKLHGYSNFDVPLLKYPRKKDVPAVAAEVEKYEAVRFLVYQTSRAGLRLKITDSNAADIAELCRLVRGVPLELMLVAGCLLSTSVKKLIVKLQNRDENVFLPSEVSTPESAALRATLEVCSSELDRSQFKLLEHLSVFRGPFTEEAARNVVGEHFHTGDMATITDRSFVDQFRDSDNQLYYCIFNATRQFFSKHAKDDNLDKNLQNLHLTHYLKTVKRLNNELKGGDQSASLNQLEKEHENILAAVKFSWTAGRIVDGAVLASQMRRFWFLRGYYDTGRKVLETALSHLSNDERQLRSQVLADAGILARMQSNYELALKYLDESITIAGSNGFQDIEGIALNAKGVLRCRKKEWGQAEDNFYKALEIGNTIGDKNLQAWVYNGLTNVAIGLKKFEDAKDFAVKSFMLKKDIGDKRGMAMSQVKMGQLELQKGNLPLAKNLFEEALEIRRELGYRSGIAESLTRLASIAIVENNLPYARDCLLEALKAFMALQDRSHLAALLKELKKFADVAGDDRRAENLSAARRVVLSEIGVTDEENSDSAAEMMLGRDMEWRDTVIETMAWLESDKSI